MKTYVLTISRVFPTTHKRKWENTHFIEKIMESVLDIRISSNSPEFLNWIRHNYQPKIHTIRSNYPLWEKRIKEVQEGKAILSLRYWSGKPYNYKQVEFAILDKDSGIGVQKLEFYHSLHFPRIVFDIPLNQSEVMTFDEQRMAIIPNTLANNDGLSLEDFKEWFKNYDLSKSMAIIHFINFRY